MALVSASEICKAASFLCLDMSYVWIKNCPVSHQPIMAICHMVMQRRYTVSPFFTTRRDEVYLIILVPVWR